jgi:hypothetical protein
MNSYQLARSRVRLAASGRTFERNYMVLNNDVYDGEGNLIGFRCFTCYEVFPSMWDVTCNRCREVERQHDELLAAIRSRKQ